MKNTSTKFHGDVVASILASNDIQKFWAVCTDGRLQRAELVDQGLLLTCPTNVVERGPGVAEYEM